MSNKFHNFFKNFLIKFSSSKKCFEDLIECRKTNDLKMQQRKIIYFVFCKNKLPKNMQKIGVFGLI